MLNALSEANMVIMQRCVIRINVLIKVKSYILLKIANFKKLSLVVRSHVECLRQRSSFVNGKLKN